MSTIHTGSRITVRPSLRTQSWSFMIGSAFFAFGSAPFFAAWMSSALANWSFFVGAIFFTAAAGMQFLLTGSPSHAAQDEHPTAPGIVVRAMWLSAAVQLIGTVLFNVSTGAALQASTITAERDYVWAPDAAGSLAFLISSVLALVPLVRERELWAPRDTAWWSTLLNLGGSVAFGISAVAAIVTSTGGVRNATLAGNSTFIGALCFFVAAAALLPSATKRRAS
ncbi:glucan phosphoethanolaminetransferase (alkaline phosphatase superfamily) [Microbacterium halimionae]|uniref:Glucan phosphoethanolaminetransferase (Alkaline phosphatase superfamily) n=1 Tax=Microbacterium halimionae TaxID=1526413 RepID=A0A7W3JPX0_9MICO|nr:hypothetical protein [Microbacterium halimionae]MBA8816784.1 glucan phosphoethanolaminetransferase (alkaline phosphatase superfamily) [Microbacterium halimionae]NII94920.1 glucan phosphoethanolaminetransferase (alkaline phosphatase superfamily) [Microbacterium halimionae]